MYDPTIVIVAFLIFGVIAISLEVLVNIKRGRGWGPTLMRIVGLIVLVPCVAALTLSSIPLERLFAAFSIIGTAGGYVLSQKETKANNGYT